MFLDLQGVRRLVAGAVVSFLQYRSFAVGVGLRFPLRVWRWILVVLRVRWFRFICSLVPQLALIDPVDIWPKKEKFAS